MIYLIYFILILMQATFLPINILLCFTVSLCVVKVEKKTVPLLFVAGLLYDLFCLKLLGLNSLFLLIVGLIIFLYQRKFKTVNMAYFFILSVFILSFEMFFLSKSFSLLKLIAEVAISLVFYLIIKITSSSKELYD